MALGVIAKCLTGILACNFYPVAEWPREPEMIMVCPEDIILNRQEFWERNRLIIKDKDATENEITTIFYLGCPKNET